MKSIFFETKQTATRENSIRFTPARKNSLQVDKENGQIAVVIVIISRTIG